MQILFTPIYMDKNKLDCKRNMSIEIMSIEYWDFRKTRYRQSYQIISKS